MKLKTIKADPEIQITFKQSELVWLQVFLNCILANDKLSGQWINEAQNFYDILRDIKPEGSPVKQTTLEFEKADLHFID